jgi:2-polyprenyl-6-methoxyphenol hydroxylase-like FAD-dependent oxidoreductase
MFAQPELERLLDARARAVPGVSVHRGHEVTAVEPRGDAVRLTVRTAGGEALALDARFVVGCDGANSFVRGCMDATVTDLGFFFDWLIVDVLPDAPKRWRPINVQVCDPARPTTLVSGGPGRRRWEFMRLPGEPTEALEGEANAWRFLAPWGVTPANATIERHAIYRFQARWVDGWRRGRLVLAGDAAHQMPPFAGQGMCSGLRDAANLAWKLDLVLAGRAADAVLDTYASERVPHVSALIDLSMSLGRVICVPDPAEAAARDASMTAAVAAGHRQVPLHPVRIGPGVTLAGDPHAGELFVQGRVARNGATGLFDDVVGRGWALLSPHGDPLRTLDPETRAFFATLGGFGAHVAADGPVRDLDGAYRRWFDERGAAVVLQRPDFYVFGTAAALAQSGSLVTALRHRLAAAT